MKEINQIARDTQLEKKISKMIYDKVFVGLEYGQVKLHGVEGAAEDIRNYFESIYCDPTAFMKQSDNELV